MEEYEKLTEMQKEKIKEFIYDNIDSVYDKRMAYGTRIHEDSSGYETEDDPDIKYEFVESVFVGYYCNECYEYIEDDSDYGLIMHVIQHLKDKDDFD